MDVVTIGETMVLFIPETVGLLGHAHQFNKTIGGAESNVAIALSRLGHKVGWISKLGNDDFGKYVRNYIRGEGVDTTKVVFDDQFPTSVFFKERKWYGEPKVIYYRHLSAASQLQPADLDEEYIAQAKYLHVTGITPALSENCKDTIFHAIDLARKNNVCVVFDPNIRLRLWSKQEAAEVLNKIAEVSDIVLPGIDEGTILTGKTKPAEIAEALLKGKTSAVIIKLGEAGAYFKTLDDEGNIPGELVHHVVDPIGAGDGFAAGLLSGLIQGLPLRKAIVLANKVAAFALTVVGDVEGFPYREELQMDASEQIFR